MGDCISELPDDILCNIISYLTVREAFIVRSLSSRWKDLPDTRFLLQFDAYTILGDKPSDLGLHTRASNFAKAVTQFLKIWSAKKTSALKIKFGLGNEYASHIDGWILSVTSKEIVELDLDFSGLSYFSSLMKTRPDKYVFPCNLLDTAKASSLKHLRLEFCNLTLVCDASTSWLSKLSIVELTCVSLRSRDLECIMSNCFDLEFLRVINCNLEGPICAQHPCLKKLVIYDVCEHVELRCPQLETFEFAGRSDFAFLNVPLLGEVCLKNSFKLRGCSAEFRDLAVNAPQLQTLYLCVTTEVPPLPPSVIMSGLKHLDLFLMVPAGFDIFSITHMVYACPVLETFHVKSSPKEYSVQSPQLQYVNRPHFHLKEVKIEPLCMVFPVFELLEYLLRNCVSLQQMVFIVGAKASTITVFKEQPTFRKWQNINPAVELIII
ncbi:F-box/FBD/LRR-repeat protein At5g56420-like [Silene latifolia]|uniref:F-box/FBD/LRR-repeat protein At5g56420-like n=1 Tax=Silene latifolia TaxID=37657 RepID=UPI003D77EE64